MEDLNTREYLDKIKVQVFENLRHTGFAPSVQMQRKLQCKVLVCSELTLSDEAIPKLPRDDAEANEDLDNPDDRKPRSSCHLKSANIRADKTSSN